MSITFKTNGTIQQIVDRTIDKKATSIFAASTWHRLYTPFVPMGDTGELASNVEYLYEEGKGIIHHKVPYAHRQYNGEGFNFKTDKHALASASWDKMAKQAGKHETLVKDVEAFVKRGAK